MGVNTECVEVCVNTVNSKVLKRLSVRMSVSMTKFVVPLVFWLIGVSELQCREGLENESLVKQVLRLRRLPRLPVLGTRVS